MTQTLTPEQLAVAKGAALERNRAERGRMYRELDRALRAGEVVTPVAWPDARAMSRDEYKRFKRKTVRELLGLG